MIAMERLVLREAKGDTLKQVVGGLSVWGWWMLGIRQL